MPKVPPVSSDDKDQLDRFALLVRELEVRQSNGPPASTLVLRVHWTDMGGTDREEPANLALSVPAALTLHRLLTEALQEYLPQPRDGDE